MNSGLSRLLLGLIFGALIALAYGWLIRPVEYIDTSPDSLRADFRTDYILMTAQAYAGDQDLTLAQVRLAALGPQPPEQFVTAAIDYALQNEFGRADLELLNQLSAALRAQPSDGELSAP